MNKWFHVLQMHEPKVYIPVRKVVASMSVVVLLVHLGLGCCWHHPHMTAGMCCGTGLQVSPQVNFRPHVCSEHGSMQHGVHSNGQVGPAEPGEESQKHSFPQECDQLRCLFVISLAPFEETKDVCRVMNTGKICVNPVPLLGGEQTHGFRYESDTESEGEKLPVRAQQVYCVFLI